MKSIISPSWLAGIGLVTGVVIYGLSSISMTLPYAPSAVSTGIMKYGIPATISASAVYFWFFHQRETWGGTFWNRVAASSPNRKARVAKLIQVIFALIAFPCLVGFSMQRWLALPTKWFAGQGVNITATCESAAGWGPRRSHQSIIIAVSEAVDGRIEFPWPEAAVPGCPGTVAIGGRSWMFGIYIESVRPRQGVEAR